MRRAIMLALCVATSGCFSLSRNVYDKFAHDDDEALAQLFISHMREGDTDAARAMLTGGADKASDEDWATMHSMMATADIGAVHLIGAHTSYTNGDRSARLVYEGPLREGHYVVQVDLEDGLITGANFWNNDRTMAEFHRFGAQTVTFSRILVLLFGLASFGFSLVTFRSVLQSSVPARRRWALASLVGVIALTIDWTTGAFSVHRLSIRLPVFLISRAGPDAPWFFTAMIPLGAIAAAERLRRHRVSRTTREPEEGDAVVNSVAP